MALNCSMLDNQNKPIPLPHEKIFLTVNGITISLVPTLPGSGTTDGEPMSPTDSNQPNSSKSKLPLSSIFSNLTLKNSEKLYPGTIYITNQRILFISNHESKDQSIKTLTIPLSNSLDGRFIQPWLSANYHLSTVLPVNGGNLEELLSSRFENNSDHPILFTLKVVFNEGHGFEFYEALEEVKRLHSESNGQRTTVLEELPTYSPTSQPNELAPIETTSDLPNANQVDSIRLHQRRDTMPDEDLILAAQTALEVERIEQDLVLETSTNLNPTHHDDHPPLYEP